MEVRRISDALKVRATHQADDIAHDDTRRQMSFAEWDREADEIGGEGSTQTDLIILTHDTREGAMNDAIAQMQALPTVLAPITRIRKEELN